MKINLYLQAPGHAIGGSEYFVCVVAQVLSQKHQVELFHHKANLTADTLTQHFGTNLHDVGLRYIAPDNSLDSFANLWRRYKDERTKYASSSTECDLFIASASSLPPFCHAPRGALIVHFPAFDRYTSWPYVNDGAGVRKRLRRAYANWEWQRRFEGYQVVMVNSEFTQKYTKEWWGLDSRVVYAPAETKFEIADKAKMILSVGRFSAGHRGASKKQLELVTAFNGTHEAGISDWDYYSVGGLDQDALNQDYFDRVRCVASRCGAHIIANIEHARLKQLYEEASIFWHAAGYGDDVNPVLMEHFGIVTVEAMAAGCVPVVIAKGGQPEIVEHGVNGFLWRTLEELKEYTTVLMRDETLRARMSGAAREHSRMFGPEAFVGRLHEALEPLLSSGPEAVLPREGGRRFSAIG